ncbi:unnamed protein product [Heterobilharzia americana]|nr:unnamed protein product [Heterobilharzia americana]
MCDVSKVVKKSKYHSTFVSSMKSKLLLTTYVFSGIFRQSMTNFDGGQTLWSCLCFLNRHHS